MNATWKVARYVIRDLVRSRWLLAYAGFFLAASALLLRFSDSPAKALISVSNVVLLVVPLANVVFGAMYLYSAREFVELLLAQPLRRGALYGGLYLGLAGPVAAASVIGLLIPLVASGADASTLATGMLLAAIAAALSAIFTAIAAAIVFAIEDRVRGLAAAIGVWLALAVVYDAVVLMAAARFADYPLERPMLAAMLANPIDLSRLLLLVRLDGAALLGYTGAVFQRFFGGAGFFVAAGAVALWVAVPALSGARLFQRKDF
ncbi:MAG TPA: ABC transporter permease subunit [Gemmatimonadaceae bacterium]|nr:ABC transporter permease subunit [Gemmatimonadaceae bacterium]